MMTLRRNLEAVVAISGWENSLGRKLLHFWQDEPTRKWHFCRLIPSQTTSRDPTVRRSPSRHHGDFEALEISENNAMLRYIHPDSSATITAIDAEDTFAAERCSSRKVDAVFLSRGENTTVKMHFTPQHDLASTTHLPQTRLPMRLPKTVRFLRDDGLEKLVLESNGSVVRSLHVPESNQWVKLARYRGFRSSVLRHPIAQPRECLVFLEKAFSLWHAPDGGKLARSSCRKMQHPRQISGRGQSSSASCEDIAVPGSVVWSLSTCRPRQVAWEAVIFQPVAGSSSYYRMVLQWTKSQAGEWAVSAIVVPHS